MAIGAVIGGAATSYFFNRSVDKVSDAIDKLTKHIFQNSNTLINTTFSQMTLQQIEASRVIQFTLQSLQNCYEHELELTVDKASQLVQNTLEQIDALVYRTVTETLTSPALKEIIDRVQMIVHQLPFADQTPYAFSISPACFIPTDLGKDIIVEVKGSFPAVLKESEKKTSARPTLSIHDQLFEGVGTQKILNFIVPAQALFPLHNRLQTRVSCSKCKIYIPFSGKTYEYSTFLHLLPENPGKITLQYKKIEKGIKIHPFSSPVFTQNSRKEKIPIINRPYTITPPQGWQILQQPEAENPRITEIACESSGKRNHQFISITPASISCTVSTYGQKGKTKRHDIGKTQFQINYLASHTELTEKSVSEEHELKWGELIPIEDSKKDCVVIFEAFDGSRQVYDPRSRIQDLFISIVRMGHQSFLSTNPSASMTSSQLSKALL